MADAADACARVVAHFDVDCFYAQAEELRRPSLRDRPVGITQKFLVVTCNYTARRLGVPKMVSIDEARKRCPDLVLINGEDLTPYRAASKHIMGVLRRFGTLERLGLDEGAVDITAEVQARVASGINVNAFSGIVIGLGTATTTKAQGGELGANGWRSLDGTKEENNCLENEDAKKTQDRLLMVGSHVVSEARAAVERETGFRMSCGIAHNKMLAKMSSSVNKPNKQTCLLQSAVAAFLEPMPARKLPGVGHRMEAVLKEMGIETVADLRNFSVGHLSQKLGERIGVFLYHACRGYDGTPVCDKGPPKSLSVEDSFRMCTTLPQVEGIMRSLAPDLVHRLDEDKAETGRTPKVLTIKWRSKGVWNFRSVSGPMPPELLCTSLPADKRREVAVEAGMRLLFHSLSGRSFCMVVLNIGATGFSDASKGISSAGDIRLFLQTPVVDGFGNSSANLQVGSQQEAFCRDGVVSDGLANIKGERRLSYEVSAGLQAVKQRSSTMGLTVISKREARIYREGHPRGSVLLHSRAATMEGETKCLQLEDFSGVTADERTGFTSDLSDNSEDEDEGGANWMGWNNTQSRRPASAFQLSSSWDSKSKVDTESHTQLSLFGFPWKSGGPGDKGVCQMDNRQNDASETSAVGTPLATPPLEVSCNESDSCFDGDRCRECGRLVEQTDQARQEHTDYHLALSLDLQENNTGSFNGRTFSRTRSREGSGTHPSFKKPRSQNGTLDAFVVRL